MVGYGTSLRRSRRRGWEAAYLDYESLKLLLTHTEAVYEEGGHRRGAGAAAGGVSPVPFDTAADSSAGWGGGGFDEEKGLRREGEAGSGAGGDYRDQIFLESDPDRAFASGSSIGEGSDFADDTSSDGSEDAKRGGGMGGVGDSIVPADANFSFSYSNEVGDELSEDDVVQRTSRRNHGDLLSTEVGDNSVLGAAGFEGYSTMENTGFVDEQGQEVVFSPAIKRASLENRDPERTRLLQHSHAASKRVSGEPYHGISFQNFLGNAPSANGHSL